MLWNVDILILTGKY